MNDHDDIPVAELVPLRLPHPGLVFATLWSALPIMAQIAVGIAVGVLAAVAFAVLEGNPEGGQDFVRTTLQPWLIPLGSLTTVVLAFAVCRGLFGSSMYRKIGWRGCGPAQFALTVLLTLPLGILASELTNWSEELVRLLDWGWLDGFRRQGSEAFRDLDQLPVVMVLIGGCVLPGLGEEIYCRGFLSRGLVARYGVVLGTLFASFLFGAMHLDPVQGSGAMFLGVALQFVYLTTRSLMAPILLHTLNNALAFTLLLQEDLLPIPGFTLGEDGSVVHTPWYLLVAAVWSAAGLLYLLWQSRTHWILPDGSRWTPGYVTAEIPPDTVPARQRRESLSLLPVVATCLFYVALIAGLVAAVRGGVG